MINFLGNKYEDIIWGRQGNDKIYGYAKNDILYGESEKDKLYGDKGDDILVGGSENDQIDGGEGSSDVAKFMLGRATIRQKGKEMDHSGFN